MPLQAQQEQQLLGQVQQELEIAKTQVGGPGFQPYVVQQASTGACTERPRPSSPAAVAGAQAAAAAAWQGSRQAASNRQQQQQQQGCGCAARTAGSQQTAAE